MGRYPDRMSGRGPLWGSGLLLRVIATGAGSCLTAGVASANPIPNPANDRTLVDEPIEHFRYDIATSCRHRVHKGMKALERWLERDVRGKAAHR